MSRLLINVEGQTEETFVDEIIAPHLYNRGYIRIGARLMGNARQRVYRGGIKGWDSARNDIIRHLRGDTGCLVTTMVDYYGLPQTGSRAWPGSEEAGRLPFKQKASTVERALLEDIGKRMGGNFDLSRFIPFVMMHEFEGLLFSDCEGFSRGIGKENLAPTLKEIRDEFNSPEEINDSPETSPSKRVKMLVKNYEKPFLGTLAALEIGLKAIRNECPHFREWLTRLEEWPNN